jgi:arylsulfatase A-like enzyme
LHVPFAIRGPGIPAGENPAMVRDVDLAPTLYELTKTAAPSDLDGRSLVPVLAAGKETAKEPVYAFAETGLWFTDEISALGPGLRLPYPGITGLTEVDREHGDDIVLRASYRPLAMTAKHRAIFDGRFKLVYVPTRDGARYMLFDRQTDPAEVRDVASEKPEERKRLATPLWAWMLRDTEMEERGGFLVHKGQR